MSDNDVHFPCDILDIDALTGSHKVVDRKVRLKRASTITSERIGLFLKQDTLIQYRLNGKCKVQDLQRSRFSLTV